MIAFLSAARITVGVITLSLWLLMAPIVVVAVISGADWANRSIIPGVILLIQLHLLLEIISKARRRVLWNSLIAGLRLTMHVVPSELVVTAFFKVKQIDTDLTSSEALKMIQSSSADYALPILVRPDDILIQSLRDLHGAMRMAMRFGTESEQAKLIFSRIPADILSLYVNTPDDAFSDYWLTER